MLHAAWIAFLPVMIAVESIDFAVLITMQVLDNAGS